jgi:hypothetical protein
VALLNLKSSILSNVSACPRSPKAVLFLLTKFLLDALIGGRIKAIHLRETPPKSGWLASLERSITSLSKSGLRGQAETLLKIEDLRFNKATIYVV